MIAASPARVGPASLRRLVGVSLLYIAWSLVGAATLVGALGEPITLVVFAPATFEPVKAIVQAGMIAIPAVLAVLGWQELRRRQAIR